MKPVGFCSVRTTDTCLVSSLMQQEVETVSKLVRAVKEIFVQGEDTVMLAVLPSLGNSPLAHCFHTEV